MREGLCAAGATNVQIAQRTQGGRGPGKKPSVGRVCGEGVNTVCSHQSQPAPWGRGSLPPNPHGSPAARAQGVTSPPAANKPPPLPSHPCPSSGTSHRGGSQSSAAKRCCPVGSGSGLGASPGTAIRPWPGNFLDRWKEAGNSEMAETRNKDEVTGTW